MAELNGYIKLYRKLILWGWYQDVVVKSLFLHCLLLASFRDFDWMDKRLKAGQFVTSYKKLAEDLGFSVQQIRTALKKLESTGEITSTSTNKFSVITVMNWENYQLETEDDNTQSNKQITNEQQTNNKQITNNQQHRKNVKNVKNIFTTTARARVHTRESAKPELCEVLAYISENKLNVDGNAFYQKYEANGWVTEAGEPITNWKNIIRVWHRKEPSQKKAAKKQGDYSAINKDLLEQIINAN